MDHTPTSTEPSTAPATTNKLALWALILGIVSAVLAIVVVISIPAAIAAIVLGIISLVKHHTGKGQSIAGVIIGGVSLFVLIPISAIIGLAVLSVIANNETPVSGTTSGQAKPSTSTSKVITDCYTYAVPAGYKYDDNSKDCHTAVNIPKGDALTRIQVKGTTGEIGTLSEVATQYDTSIKAAFPGSKGVIDQEQFTANGKTVYYISYEDSYKLLAGLYIVVDLESTQTISGEPINAYSILGYTYNSQLKGNVRSVVDSLITK